MQLQLPCRIALTVSWTEIKQLRDCPKGSVMMCNVSWSSLKCACNGQTSWPNVLFFVGARRIILHLSGPPVAGVDPSFPLQSLEGPRCHNVQGTCRSHRLCFHSPVFQFLYFWFIPESVWAQGSSNSGVCISSSHLHILLIFTPSHLHILSSSHLFIFTSFSSSHLLIFTSFHLYIFSSSHLLIFTSSHLHTFSTSHLLIFTSSYLHTFSSSHLLIFTPSHLHIFSSSHLLIFTSSHIHTFSSSHLLIFTSSHFTSSHLHIFSSSHLLIFTPSKPSLARCRKPVVSRRWLS